MIDKIANNKTNQEELKLNPIDDVWQKLEYYKLLLGKTHDFSTTDFEKLKIDINTFFNLKSARFTDSPPERLVRISNNSRIFKAQSKEVTYFTQVSQLLAPPIQCCDFGRCNMPNQQVLYCATNEATAYWEAKPKKGDIITISHYELKPNTKVNCNVISQGKTPSPKISNQLQEIFYLLDDFFIDVYSFEVSRDRPRDYIFSALLSEKQLFNPIPSEKNIEAIIYPSVQKKKFGENFAIRNELIFEKYNLIGVETRFITEEYQELDPTTNNLTTDSIIGSLSTNKFDFKTGQIIYNQEIDRLFNLFKMMQANGDRQIRYENPEGIKNIPFNVSPTMINAGIINNRGSKVGRNEKVNVIYQDGSRKENIKYKKVIDDINKGLCRVINF